MESAGRAALAGAGARRGARVVQAGDLGVQSVQSITLGTSLVTGAVSLILYRLIDAIFIGISAVLLHPLPDVLFFGYG